MASNKNTLARKATKKQKLEYLGDSIIDPLSNMPEKPLKLIYIDFTNTKAKYNEMFRTNKKT